MLHGVEISIKQYAGMCKGVYKTEPLDCIYAAKGENKRLLGYVARVDGATCLLIRHLKPELREPVRLEVERLRIEQGGCSISKLVSCPPDPKVIKAYVKGELRKPAKATVVMPGDEEYELADNEPDDEEFDDE